MARFEAVTGKYIYLEVQGVEYRVYFEENGKGIPLLCQHTAGSDGRQWRHLLNDKDVIAKYRVIVPDLPYHGKSLPPESVEWWKEEYILTQSFLIDFHVGLSHALELQKPVYIGSSMGGKLAPDLALERPDEFRAVIGFSANLGGDAALGMMRSMQWRHHPRISDEYKVASMFGRMAPNSPEKYRRETAWEYGQSAPPVFAGDLIYNSIEHNLIGKAHKIDTSRIAVYLLTGEYDAGVSPDITLQLVKEIKGAKFTEMKGLGHFPMSENFEALKKYLMPVLDEIAKQKVR